MFRGHDADGCGLSREEAYERRGADWWVNLRRRDHKIVRLFKDGIYGSGNAAYIRWFELLHHSSRAALPLRRVALL